MNFSEVLIAIREDDVFAFRKGWEEGACIFFIVHWIYYGAGRMIFPQTKTIVMKNADRSLVPYIPTHADLLAEDWSVARKTYEKEGRVW